VTQNASPAYPEELYGHDPADRIVGLHPLRTDDEGSAIRVYRRTGDDRVEHEDVPFYPFFFLSDLNLLRDFPRARYRYQQLEGDGFFRYLIVLDGRGAYWDAVRAIERARGSQKNRPAEVYLPGTPEQQYLLQSGRTLFKGMGFDDLHRLQLDIEVYAPAGFPVATRPENGIIIVALSDNRGWSLLLDTRRQSERDLLASLAETIRQRDPDVIEGHNLYAFDLAYILKRCELLGVPFEIGRNGSAPRTFETSMRFAERTIDFPGVEIAGRHVVDTLFQVMSYDVFKRDLPGYGLKEVARYFGFADESRTYVAGSDIARVWDEEPERLLAYALDDVRETERIARHLSGSTFYLTQMLPMSYGHVARTGPAAKIESLFVREYLRRRRSLPRAEWGNQALGGYTDVFVTGVVGPVVYADVESLYPSIMLHYDVRPKSDSLGLFPTLLRRLTDLRFEAKSAARTASSAGEKAELDARQNAYKVIINSFYGSLGFGMALFNDFAEADRVAATGQELLRQMMLLVREAGGTVVEVDTDGVLFVPPTEIRGEEAEQAFVRQLSEAMPEGIRIGFDGRFRKMLSYKKKNYALQTYDGALKFKGSSLVSRSIERFGRRFVRDAVQLLLDEDIEGLHDLYLATRDRVTRHEWAGVEDFQRTETLKETPEQYLADVDAGRRPRAASYELAIRRAAETGQPVRKGDRIAFYISGSGAGVTAFEHARLADAWNPAAPDENTEFYLRRLDEFAGKFVPFFETEHEHRLVFSPEDLFGFDSTGIRLARRELSPEDVQDDVPF
jgi:DNA polymerase, archaea type